MSAKNPLILLADKIGPHPHLISLIRYLQKENSDLPSEQELKYAVCADSIQVVLTMRDHGDAVKMVLLGPGLVGSGVCVARMLANKTHIVMAIDPLVNPLDMDPAAYQLIEKNLKGLGIHLVLVHEATEAYYQPLIQEHVLADITPGINVGEMSPQERRETIDKRLDATNKFPSLPETQRKVAALDDMDSPKKWAEAIEPDLPTRTVILRILNSARYGLRSRVEAIEQAVTLASAKTIRELVMACQIRQLFRSVDEAVIDRFWQHSLAVGFWARLLSLPADPAEQSTQEKTEFNRYQLEEHQIVLLQELQLWKKFELGEQDDAFTAGLLHDIGKIGMLLCLEDAQELINAVIETEFNEAQEEGKLWATNQIDIERFLMKDLDHQVIGGRLAESWELSAQIQLVAAGHHTIVESTPDLVKLIALADLAANTMFPYQALDTRHPFPRLMERINQTVKEKEHAIPNEAALEAINGEMFEDLVSVLDRLKVPSILWECIDFKTLFQVSYVLAPQVRSTTIAFMQQTGG